LTPGLVAEDHNCFIRVNESFYNARWIPIPNLTKKTIFKNGLKVETISLDIHNEDGNKAARLTLN